MTFSSGLIQLLSLGLDGTTCGVLAQGRQMLAGRRGRIQRFVPRSLLVLREPVAVPIGLVLALEALQVRRLGRLLRLDEPSVPRPLPLLSADDPIWLLCQLVLVNIR